MLALLVFGIIANVGANAQGLAIAEPTQQIGYVWILSLPECQGKDAGNYTRVTTISTGSDCSQVPVQGPIHWIVNEQNGKKKTIVNVDLLTSSVFPDGAHFIFESITLATNGPLEGKYLFLRIRHLDLNYFKKCSSVLGLSVIVSTFAELLISDRLSPEVLITPNGGYEAFKRIATTVCRGEEIGV